MLERDQTVLVLIDVQERLTAVMFEREDLLDAVRKLLRGVALLGVPVLWTEQTPAKMGPTVAPVAELLGSSSPVPKSSFSCLGEPAFVRALDALGRRQALLAGIESHVCVCQTAMDLLARGCRVEAVAEAVSSRTRANRDIGLHRMAAAGAAVTSVETALFELLRSAEDPSFREVLRLIK